MPTCKGDSSAPTLDGKAGEVDSKRLLPLLVIGWEGGSGDRVSQGTDPVSTSKGGKMSWTTEGPSPWHLITNRSSAVVTG